MTPDHTAKLDPLSACALSKPELSEGRNGKKAEGRALSPPLLPMMKLIGGNISLTTQSSSSDVAGSGTAAADVAGRNPTVPIDSTSEANHPRHPSMLHLGGNLQSQYCSKLHFVAGVDRLSNLKRATWRSSSPRRIAAPHL
jgi:hypothetical protein